MQNLIKNIMTKISELQYLEVQLSPSCLCLLLPSAGMFYRAARQTEMIYYYNNKY